MAAGVKLIIKLDDKATPKLSKFQKAFQRMKNEISKGAKQIAAGFNRIRSAAAPLGNVLKRSMQAAGLALAGLGTAAIIVGSQFEQGMANVKAVTNATAQELVELEQVARGLGATTAFSAREASDAMFSLASAGLDVGKIKSTTKPVLLLAGALKADLGPAAELTTAALAQFKLGADEAGRVVNVLAAANRRSKLNFDRLQASMAQVAPIANAANIGLEDTVAVLGILVDAGIDASAAGTGFKNVIAQLSAPNATLKAQLQGVSLQSDGLAAVMEQLGKTMKGPADAFKAFGRVGATAAVQLAGAQDKFKELSTQITGTNEAQRQYNDQMNTVASQTKIIKSAMEENFIAVFKELAPTIREGQAAMLKFIERTKPLVVGAAKFTARWVKENKELIKTIAANAAKALVFAAGLMIVVKAVGAIVAVAKILWGTIQIGIGVIRIMRAAWIFMHAAALGPWGVIAVVAAAVITGLVLLIIKFKDQIQEAMTKVKDFVVKVFNAVRDKVLTVFNAIRGFLSKIIPGFEETADVMEASMGGAALGAVKVIVGAGGDIVNNVTGWVNTIKDGAAKGIAKLKELGAAAAGAGVPSKAEEAAAPAVETSVDLLVIPRIPPGAMKDMTDHWEAGQIMLVARSRVHTEAWLDAKSDLIEQQLHKSLADESLTLAQRATLITDSERDLADVKIEHQDAVFEHWQLTNERMVLGLDALSAAYDTFYEGLFEKEMTSAKRREAVMNSVKRSFIKNSLDMTKAFIKNRLKSIAVAQAAEQSANKVSRFGAAKIGAVKAYSAFAGVPIIGPALGAIAAAAAFAFLMAFQKGGLVPGFGSGDSVGASLTPGEFVIRQPAVQAIGVGNLAAANRTGRLPATGAGDTLIVQFPISERPEEDDFVEEVQQEVVPILEDLFRRRRLNLERIDR